jgi:argininosuccinate lyase
MGYGAFTSAARVLDLLTALLPALRIDGRRVAENVRRSCITVTELADSLVRMEGLSFRDAHEIAAAVARAVVAADGDLPTDGYEPFAAAFTRATGRSSRIDSRGFAEIVSPQHFVAVRGRFGGPAPEALDASLGRYLMRLGQFEREAQSFGEREAASARELAACFAALAGEP